MLLPDHFDYKLPQELIAHAPVEPRDGSKLLIVDRKNQTLKHAHFYDLADLLTDQDVIVRNNTKVIPARIIGQKPTGGHYEVLLIKVVTQTATSCVWECLTKPGLKIDQTLRFADSELSGRCIELNGMTRLIEFDLSLSNFFIELDKIGQTPTPPYIHWDGGDEARLRQLYQTTFAKIQGSAAAPTAGLHFTTELDQKLKSKGVEIIEVTLHVGLGTFLPLNEEQLKSGKLHHERFEVTASAAHHLTQAKLHHKRIIAVGTTTTRVLETLAKQTSPDQPFFISPTTGETDLFIQPGYKFKFVDSLLTNFHLPKSSLLYLVSALEYTSNTSKVYNFRGSLIERAYQEAIAQQYRFFSFGDAMWIV